MAHSSSSSSSFVFTLAFWLSLLSSFWVSQSQLALDSEEQDSAYQVLDSINSDIPWRSIFPGDLCSSAPHGVVCNYFSGEADGDGDGDGDTGTPHITELNFGYVSDYSPNPPCSPYSTLNPLIFSSFKYLRKLFFYKCFTRSPVSLPEIPESFGSSLEELVFVENPSLVGPLAVITRNLTRLRRLVLTGTGVNGKIPDEVANQTNLEELKLSQNNLSGELTLNLANLKKLKILDLSHNHLQGNVSDTIGRLSQLQKLDLSWNRFTGEIPEHIKHLQRLEFLDLSYNGFSKSGVPSFFGQMPMLREVYLSGNKLGGQIPEIWENLGGILGIGLSEMELVGKIPASMGVYLRNLSYLGLDNNRLEGTVPEEFGLLEKVNELNLEHNELSGRLPFSSKFASRVGRKLRLKGNSGLCVEEGLASSVGTIKICSRPDLPNSNPGLVHGGSSANHFHQPVLLGFTGFLLRLVLF